MTTGITFLLDTNIISALMKDRSGTDTARVLEWGRRTPDCTLVTSVVVQYELLFGLARHGSPRLQAAFDIQMQSLVVLPLDEAVGPHYAKLRSHLEQAGTPIGANDTLIAAHAMSLGATLVTADAEFTRVPGLRVENWLSQ
ncbi:MAG: type II toxin-antitoxin system VapC family toxin [Rhodoferax sp.]|uniref:type II toxin-antitoxin system VapC family toxin n=1 Tax=Rhodoferax sp. TaxID=50421 RepID=UPI002715C87B|nr:type II toxin-antitoxin system VapC family toxin [Rhodoferax sp.]MDO8450310.1 type II toxin-antitoxin system VapC family toxin [Rhodoferax sp.]